MTDLGDRAADAAPPRLRARDRLAIEAGYVPEGGAIVSLRGDETLVGSGTLLSDALYDLARQVRLVEAGDLSTVALDAMNQRAANALRRGGVRTDRELAGKTCLQLLRIPGLGRTSAIVIVRAVAATRLRLRCGCGWDGERLDVCQVGHRYELGGGSP